jgi:hypothetical protein
MHKHHPSVAREYHVRSTWKILAVQSVAETQRVRRATHNKLGLGVSLPDRSHDSAALRYAQFVQSENP